MLRVLALRDSDPGVVDRRWKIGKAIDSLLERLGVLHLAVARGASCWLIVQRKAELMQPAGSSHRAIYADITQGDDATLFAGEVEQVITSPSGETHSVVLKKAKRYRRAIYSEPDEQGNRREILAGEWKAIGDSEAFYMRGDNVHDISYRIYGDPSRGGYSRVEMSRGKEVWQVPDGFSQAVESASSE